MKIKVKIKTKIKIPNKKNKLLNSKIILAKNFLYNHS